MPAAPNPTERVWSRMARPLVLDSAVGAFLGLSPEAAAQLAGVTVAASSTATALIEAMPSLVRRLTTSVDKAATRVRGEVRGPVAWSQTISARGSSAGDPDLFVCFLPQRDYDTPENRVLVRALLALAESERSVTRVGSDSYDDGILRHARLISRQAGRYLEHPALSTVTRARIPAKTLQKARNGKKRHDYAPALAMYELALEPLSVADLRPFCDRRTRKQHALLAEVFDELERRGLRIPPIRAERGALLAGPVTYVHPRRLGARDRVHGVLVGDVLLDVPEGASVRNRARAEARLADRAAGRATVLITDLADVPEAIDRAVLSARRKLVAAT
jgi:hypothetical protein